MPSELKILKFGYSYSVLIKPGILPSQLQNLTFGISFNKTLKNVLPRPRELKYLKLGEFFKQRIDEKTLPCSLTYFKNKSSSRMSLHIFFSKFNLS